jgi:hypothetical protein
MNIYSPCTCKSTWDLNNLDENKLYKIIFYIYDYNLKIFFEYNLAQKTIKWKRKWERCPNKLSKLIVQITFLVVFGLANEGEYCLYYEWFVVYSLDWILGVYPYSLMIGRVALLVFVFFVTELFLYLSWSIIGIFIWNMSNIKFESLSIEI